MPKPAQRIAETRRRPLWALPIVHLLLALSSSIVARWNPAPQLYGRVLFYAIIATQACLCAFWLSFGSAEWPTRLVGVLAWCIGVYYLFRLARVGYADLMIALGAFLAIALVGLACRLSHWKVQVPDAPLVTDPRTHGQTHLKTLMLLVVVAALYLAAVARMRWSLIFVVIVSVSNVALVGITSFWAALCGRQPVVPVLVVIATTVGMGAIFAVAADSEGTRGILGSSWNLYLTSIAPLVIQALLLLPSLLMVRFCGYRIVHRPTAIR